MCPGKASVFLIDNESLWTRAAKSNLEKAGHVIVVEAKDPKSARSKFDQAVESGANVAVINGNLTGSDWNCNEARDISTTLRRLIPTIKVVAFGSEKADFGDIRLQKATSTAKLGQVVKTL